MHNELIKDLFLVIKLKKYIHFRGIQKRHVTMSIIAFREILNIRSLI